VIVKVCGMRDADNIREVEALGVDWMGFIFWEPSKRYCSKKPDYLPSCKRVGVFVNAKTEEIVEKVKEYELDVIQLHGDETRASVVQVRKAIFEAGIEKCPLLVKALSLKVETDLRKCEEFVGFVDYFLFDTPTPGYGGTGQKFDWSLLDGYCKFTPFILSGGIGIDSIPALANFSNPMCCGIDLNSKFEDAPGLKNVEKIREMLFYINKSN